MTLNFNKTCCLGCGSLHTTVAALQVQRHWVSVDNNCNMVLYDVLCIQNFPYKLIKNNPSYQFSNN